LLAHANQRIEEYNSNCANPFEGLLKVMCASNANISEIEKYSNNGQLIGTSEWTVK